MGAYSRGGLFVKISFRGGGLFERGLIREWRLNREWGLNREWVLDFCELFNQTNVLGNGPADILLDFDISAIYAFRSQNQPVEVKGYFYHLCSNI